ncbi:MAG: zinc finger domain-containing protein, partial [Janthinobacterium lividum]
IGSSLQAVLEVPLDFLDQLDAETWAEIAIVSAVQPSGSLLVLRAPGEKCARCWRVLPEVGGGPSQAPVCMRCEAVVEALPGRKAAAE